MSNRLGEELSKIRSDEINIILEDRKFKFLHKDVKGDELIEKAKQWWLIQELEKQIAYYRISKLINQDQAIRPEPYNHPALNDLNLSPDFLVSLSEFDIKGNALIRNGFAFTFLPNTEQVNSQYWILQALIKLSKNQEILIRLDPLIFSSAESFQAPMYKMYVFGKSLDWNRIVNLQESDYGQFRSEQISTSETTDFVWQPRNNNEIHFICEEIPRIEYLSIRGSRYFHAIYSKSEESVIHLDGAIRYLTESEHQRRTLSHVRNIGKLGTRIKIFRIDEPLDKEHLADLCLNFFVWNYDIIRYFEQV